MRGPKGMTLLEILVVIVILGIAAALFLPNYTVPTEQSRAANARNNLLAVYSAQQNYNNNHGGNNNYCINSGAYNTCDNLADINNSLSLNIQDDGTYSYSCSSSGVNFICAAARANSPSNLVITVTLNQAVQLQGGVNPTCTSTTGNSNWCP